MQVTHAEKDFWIETSLKADNTDNSEVVGLAMCIHRVLITARGRPCLHSRDQPYIVPNRKDRKTLYTFVSTLSGKLYNKDSLEFVTLQGSTLEQLL